MSEIVKVCGHVAAGDESSETLDGLTRLLLRRDLPLPESYAYDDALADIQRVVEWQKRVGADIRARVTRIAHENFPWMKKCKAKGRSWCSVEVRDGMYWPTARADIELPVIPYAVRVLIVSREDPALITDERILEALKVVDEEYDGGRRGFSNTVPLAHAMEFATEEDMRSYSPDPSDVGKSVRCVDTGEFYLLTSLTEKGPNWLAFHGD